MSIKDENYSDMLAKGIMFFWKKPDKSEIFDCSADSKEHHFLWIGSSDIKIVFDDGSEKNPSIGSVCYIPPETGYEIISKNNNPDISSLVCFGILADAFAASCKASTIQISLRPTAVDSYTSLYDRISNIEPGTENINRTASDFFTLLMDIIFSPSHLIESKPAVIAQKIKQYIETNIDSDISVTSIAKQFYLSETHVIRIFREKYGITPKQYILKTKINASKLLLLDTSLQIKEIAMTYHFADSYHFSHTFKRFTGVSPEKYRLREEESK